MLLNDCINNEANEDVGTDITSTLTLCLSYLRNTNATDTNVTNNNNKDTTTVATTTVGTVTAPPTPVLVDDSELEEGELERRQAATNEWKQHQLTPSVSNSTWQPVNLMDGLDSSSHGNSLDGSESSRVGSDISAAHILHAASGAGILSSNTSISSMARIQSDEGMIMATKISDSQDEEDDPQQRLISRPPPTLVAATPSSLDHCANCRQLLTQLDQQIEQKAYLKRDLGALASALAEEEQVRETVEQSRVDLVDDIQDITSSLFGTLNQVVMDEVTDREGLLRLNREYNGSLANVLQAWDARDQRLKEIKELLVDLDASVHQTTTTDRPLSLGQGVDECGPTSSLAPYLPDRHSRVPSTLSAMDESLSMGSCTLDRSTIRVDGVNFREFQGHLKALTSSINNKNNKPSSPAAAMSTNQHLPSSPFMKRVLAEDIEPCLFQNNGTSWWKSPWFKRKLIDAIANNKCEIQHAIRPLLHGTGMTTQTTTTLSSTSTSSASTLPSIASSSFDMPMPPKTKCTCCGLLRVCEFKMRLHHPSTMSSSTTSTLKASGQQQQPWLPIDRFCRDRLVAVCDFYGFLSHLPQAARQNTPVLVMFKQSLLFRRKMAMAKVGSVGLFSAAWDSTVDSASASPSSSSSGLRSMQRQSGSVKRRSRSSKRESIVLDHSGNASDTGSVVSLSDIQGLDGTSQIVIVH